MKAASSVKAKALRFVLLVGVMSRKTRQGTAAE
jgi:hypothetical protein